MSVMSVREFNAGVSRAIAMVEAGETIDITKNGKVVAELRPKLRDKRNDPAFKAAHARLMEMLAHPLDLGGPATCDERTGR